MPAEPISKTATPIPIDNDRFLPPQKSTHQSAPMEVIAMPDNNPITLTETAKLSPGRPSANAVWRWCRKGVKSRAGHRVRLDHIRAGGKIFTSQEALQQFFASVAEADAIRHRPNHSRTGTRRQREIKQANEVLDQAGI
jgi:hypothetical protein